MVDSIVRRIIDRFVTRAEFGKQKYGTDLDRKDLNLLEWIQHLQDELHDAYLYSEKLKVEYQEKLQFKQEVTDVTVGVVNNTLRMADHNGVLAEVVATALNKMKQNPSLSIEEAIADGSCEWIN